MTENEFMDYAEAAFERIEHALDDTAAECSVNEGVLQIEFDNGSRIIVNRHLPNREIWVAAKAGGFHYAWRDGEWRNTRDGGELFEALAKLISAQAGEEVTL